MKQKIKQLVTLGAIFLVSAGLIPAHADTYPDKPITVVVPFAPGGGTDVITRIVAQKLSEKLGQTVIVENRAGAGGNIGAALVARAKNDGYTLLAGAIVAHAVNMTLQHGNTGYDLEKDFAPISLLSSMPVTMVVNKSFPAKSLKDFIEYAKKRPGEVTYASAGIGTTQHLAAEFFQQLTGTKMIHVGYKGSGPAITDVISGQVMATFEVGTVAYPHVKTGKLHPIFIADKERSSTLKEVPTANEVGLAGFEVGTIYGFLAPAGTPAPIVNRLNSELAKILKMPDVKQKFEEQGAEPVYTTPAETASRVRGEITRWAKVIKTANMKAQ
jgi:tripartite-type tricarboxylate transporter receptor subunit TctC